MQELKVWGNKIKKYKYYNQKHLGYEQSVLKNVHLILSISYCPSLSLPLSFHIALLPLFKIFKIFHLIEVNRVPRIQQTDF